MRPTRWTIFDTRSSVREMYPALSSLILVCLIAAPLGFVPKELLDLPNWYRGFSFVTLQCECTPGELVTFKGLGRRFFKFDDDQDRVLFVIGRK